MINVTVVVEGVEPLDERHLHSLGENMVVLLKALDPMPVYWPKAKEIGMQFQLTEEAFGRLLQPVESSKAA